MKIINFKAENIKKIVVAEITPDKDLVVISGNNGAGKSSILDAIFWALSGTKQIQDKPIRDGQDKAYVRLDLGEIVVERRFTDKGSYLYVSSEHGGRFTNPQEVLGGLIGAITFDPLEFARMDSKKQLETLRALVPLDVDVDELDRRNKADFEERRLVNREVDNLKAQLQGIELPETKPERANLNDLIAKRDEYQSVNNARFTKKTLLSQVETEIGTLTAQIAELQRKLEARTAEYAILNNQLAEMPEIEQSTIDSISTQIATAGEQNALIDRFEQREAMQQQLANKSALAQSYTVKMEERANEKKAAMARASMPVDGLSFGEMGVEYNEIPFEQSSTAEQIKISTAIAMAANPKLRVIRIKDGSLLDDAAMRQMQSLAAQHDFQIWIERVGEDPMGIVIEDGTIKGQSVAPEKNEQQEALDV